MRDAPIVAVYDRFPSRRDPTRFAALVAQLGDVPMANPPALMALFQDKLATQEWAQARALPIPDAEADTRAFAARLADWGQGFLKPRYGTAGRDVALWRAGEPRPERPLGPTVEADGPRFLQRAIRPYPPWRGLCVRVAAQRRPDGAWHYCRAVARYSERDPVAGGARGSDIAPADQLLPRACNRAIADLCARICAAAAAHPDGAWLAEIGIDLVIDEDQRPWLLELNSRPLGRLGALAARDPEHFEDAHLRACMRPLRFLARRAGA